MIESIEKYGKSHPDKLKYTDRLLLANENEQFSWFEKSLVHAEKALELSVDSWQFANAYWCIARINGKLNKLNDMRTFYAKAVHEFDKIGLNSTALSVMQLYTQWINVELFQNDSCIQAKKIFDAMKAVYSGPEVWPATKETVRIEFQKMLSMAKKTCDLEL